MFFLRQLFHVSLEIAYRSGLRYAVNVNKIGQGSLSSVSPDTRTYMRYISQLQYAKIQDPKEVAEV